jgi:diamine N-acetyltransferase
VSAFIERFTSDVGEVHVALSYAADNRIARDLYRELGFVETGEMADDEIVARLVRHRTP